jgi:CRP/FNR family cyclic AMP-dependent transcriptional regulator
MSAQENSNDFFIWGLDHTSYGPVELPTLISWIKDERVFGETWIFLRKNDTWQRASDIPELQMFFKKKAAAATADAGKKTFSSGSLRRIKILADLNDAQLDQLTEYMEVRPVPQWTAVVKQGDAGDGMYFVLEGELRARVLMADKETTLSTFGPGDFFGDMSLFDQGPRSADVIANCDSTVIKVSALSFEKLTREAPALATPLLQATARTMAARIRADNKRLSRVQQLSTSST